MKRLNEREIIDLFVSYFDNPLLKKVFGDRNPPVDKIQKQIAKEMKAGIIKPVEEDSDEELLMLVMPLMLNS